MVDPDSALAQVAVSGRLTAIVEKFKPAVILISGCQDNQTSMDGDHNGAFTEQLLRSGTMAPSGQLRQLPCRDQGARCRRRSRPICSRSVRLRAL